MDAVISRVASRRSVQSVGAKKRKGGADVPASPPVTASSTMMVAPVSFSLKEVAIIVRSLDYVQQQACGEVEQDEYHSVLTAMSKLARLSGLEGPRDFGYFLPPRELDV